MKSVELVIIEDYHRSNMQLESQVPANRAGFYCIAIAPCRGPHRRLTTITIG